MSRANTSNLEEFRNTSRFIVERRLGSGGFGVVYQVFDRERNSSVALKTLRRSLYIENASALYRFKQEFRALVDVAHPNLVSFYELFSDGEQWFFTMELIEGINFLEYIHNGLEIASPNTPTLLSGTNDVTITGTDQITIINTQSNRGDLYVPDYPIVNLPISIDNLRAALRQLALGVNGLHDAQKLHCDLKPSNVMVTHDGRVVILDFGLITELSPHREIILEEFVGTPAYMSPEQAAGIKMSEASDWYSVGVILYEALTGRLPFTGDLKSLLASKDRLRPVTPYQLVPDLPEDLVSLCMDLLERNPDKRPNGNEVLRRLNKRTKEDKEDSSNLSRQQAITLSPPTLSLIGREHHLATLQSSLQRVKRGESITVFVHGSSGMGKSSLIKYFLDDIQRDQNIIVLTGRCYERESVPYKALDSLIDALSQYLRTIPAYDAERLMPTDVATLVRLFPVLGQIEAVAGARREVLEIPDSQELRRRAFAALKELFIRLAKLNIVVLFIDDLQWGDVDSALLLGELLRPPLVPPLLLIGSYRSEEEESSAMLSTLLPLHRENANMEKLAIRELNFDQAKELAQQLMGHKNSDKYGDINNTLYKERAELIAHESRGNPFFIDELVRYFRTGTNVNAPQKSISLEELINIRIARLPLATQKMLELVAVAGTPLELDIARKIIRLGAQEQSAIGQLRKEHLIRSRGAFGLVELETYHDRIRETIVASLAPEVLSEHHRNLATALEATGHADAETLATHFEGAGSFEQAAHYAIIAADQSMQALAFDRAAELYQRALKLQRANQAGLPALQVKYAIALTNAGRGPEAAQAFLDAAVNATESEKIDLQRRAAEQYLRSGHIDKGLELSHIVMASLGMKLPKTTLHAILVLIFRKIQLYLRGLKFTERQEFEVDRDDLMRIDTCWSIATGLGQVDPIIGVGIQTKHLLLALAAGEPYRVVRALAFEAAYSSAQGGKYSKRTRQFTDSARALAERLNNQHAFGLTLLTDGHTAFQEGHWKIGQKLMDECEEITRAHCTGAAWELDTAQYYALCSLQHMGLYEKVVKRLSSLLPQAKEHGDLYAETLYRLRYSSIQYLADDEPERAFAELSEAIGKWSHQAFHHQHYLEISSTTKSSLYIDWGKGDRAWKYLKEKWPILKRSLFLEIQVVRIEAYHLRACSAMAAATTAVDATPFLKFTENYIKRIEKERMPWGIALTKLLRASLMAFYKQREQALALLFNAENELEMVDMYLLSAAARRRRGEMLGNSEGKRLIDSADEWMRGQLIKNPQRITTMLAPGRWGE